MGSGPTRGGAGPMGDRFEHTGPLAADDATGEAVAKAWSRAAVGNVPPDLLAVILTAGLEGVPRVVAAGTIPRRSIVRAAVRAFHGALQAGAGPRQFACGRTRGSELFHQTTSAKAAARLGRVVVVLDVASAFARAKRASTLRAVQKYCPELMPLAVAWL